MMKHNLIQKYHDYYRFITKKVLSEHELTILTQAIPLFKERSSTLREFGDITQFLITNDTIMPDTKSQILLNNPDNLKILHNIIPEFQKISEWNNDAIVNMFKDFLTNNALKMPNIGPLLRACVAGVTNTPDLASVLAILGKEKTIERIQKYIK